MSKAVKTTLHPDVQLINQYQEAQTVINQYQTRLNAITAALMAATSQPAPEALEDAKGRIDAFLEGAYKSKSALRGAKLDMSYALCIKNVPLLIKANGPYRPVFSLGFTLLGYSLENIFKKVLKNTVLGAK